jgi:hypothetical protein
VIEPISEFCRLGRNRNASEFSGNEHFSGAHSAPHKEFGYRFERVR